MKQVSIRTASVGVGVFLLAGGAIVKAFHLLFIHVNYADDPLPFVRRAFESHSLVSTSRFLPPEEFPWAKVFEDNFDTIRGELDALLQDYDALPGIQEVVEGQEYIENDDNGWKTYPIGFFERYSKFNKELCPVTEKLIKENIPGPGVMLFSILGPGKRLTRHQGKWKGWVTWHLGLKIPEPNDKVGIEVDGEFRTWTEGQSLFLDDTFDHEAWNDSDEPRAVLMVFFRRPMSFPMNWVNWIVGKIISVTPTINSMMAKGDVWERTFKARVQQRLAAENVMQTA